MVGIGPEEGFEGVSFWGAKTEFREVWTLIVEKREVWKEWEWEREWTYAVEDHKRVVGEGGIEVCFAKFGERLLASEQQDG